MNGFKRRLLVLMFAITTGFPATSCEDSGRNVNKLPPHLPGPSPSPRGGAANANSGPEPGPQAGPTAATGEKFCESDNASGDRQRCVFRLEGYPEAEYTYHDPKALDTYVSRVAGYIEEAMTVKGCRLLSVTAWGYADNQSLNKDLPWSDVPEYCRSPESCRPSGTTSANLTNSDLACVRGCIVTNQIYSLLQHDVEIYSQTLEKWESRHRPFTLPTEVGDPYRKVEIILERGGGCPDD